MTIEDAKAVLPNVLISVDGKVCVGKTGGRMNDLATVGFMHRGVPCTIEVPWSTIAVAVTEDRTIAVRKADVSWSRR